MSTDINISNYESYLYSYVDGELNAEEMAALEHFASTNPQVQAELDLLMATRLQPENIVFDNKAALYRGSEIHLQNYEGYLLSYIDGELAPEEEKAFEQFLARHPKVREELVMWQGTKMHADPSIRFENKEVLYRHTKNRVVRMRPAYWWAAAAMVAGVLLFIKLSSDRDTTIPSSSTLADVKKVQPAPVEKVQPAPESKDQITPKNEKQASDVAQKQPVIATAPKEVRTVTAPQEKAATTVDLASIRTEKTTALEIDRQQMEATLSGTPKEVLGSTETVLASNIKPSLDDQTPPAALATPPPAAEPPGELIMSVTGNGLESKVLDKVTNVAKFFARKKKQ
jgi:anti-sigma factor RsiW